MVEIVDIVNTLIQSFLISYFPYYSLVKDNLTTKKEGKIKLLWSFIFISTIVVFFTYTIKGKDLLIIIVNLSNMIVIGCIYYKNYRKAIISYFIVYFIMQISVIACSSINWPIASILSFDQNLARIISVYIPVIIVELITLYSVKHLYSIYKYFTRYSYYFGLSILFIFAFDYILSISVNVHKWSDILFKNLTLITFSIYIIIAISYMYNMNTKMLEIEKLNNALNNKNNELKKIKHDYGSQISYINGLCLMDQYDRLKELLQKIIKGNDLVSDNVKIISNDNSIIAHIVNSLNTQGVHIIIDEEFDLNKIDIPEHDMHKILSNIIKNALTALNNNGLIIIKTYKIFTTVYVSIKNNGPKVDSDIIDKIFDFGFTTKEEFNNDDHGCGLSIVKELAENNNGKVYVDSNLDYTEFKLLFKI